MFFNASAPNQGRINVSPKGLDTFCILSNQRDGLPGPDWQRVRNGGPPCTRTAG